jgi:hypothetical protein
MGDANSRAFRCPCQKITTQPFWIASSRVVATAVRRKHFNCIKMNQDQLPLCITTISAVLLRCCRYFIVWESQHDKRLMMCLLFLAFSYYLLETQGPSNSSLTVRGILSEHLQVTDTLAKFLIKILVH